MVGYDTPFRTPETHANESLGQLAFETVLNCNSNGRL